VITGLLVVEVEGVPPGKLHSQDVALVELVFEKVTLTPVQPETLFAVKLAVGGVTTTTDFIILFDVQELVAVNVTLYVPSAV
jgi:hypothetical protein